MYKNDINTIYTYWVRLRYLFIYLRHNVTCPQEFDTFWKL